MPAAALINALAAVLPFRKDPDKYFPHFMEGVMIGFLPEPSHALVLAAGNLYAQAATTTDPATAGNPWATLGIPDDWRYANDAPAAFYIFPTNAARVLGDLRAASGGTRRKAHPSNHLKVYADPETGDLHIEGEEILTFPTRTAHHGVGSVINVLKTHLNAEPMTPRVEGLAFNPDFLALFAAFSPDHREPVRFDFVPCNAGRDGLSIIRGHAAPNRHGFIMPLNH